MTININNIKNLEKKFNFISNVSLESYEKVYNKKTIHSFLPSLKTLRGRNNNLNYPLSINTWDHKEIEAIHDVTLSQNFTMGKNVKEFEKKFANYFGSKYSIMVNSGSSANLLMIASLVLNKDIDLNAGDEVIVPTLSWATTYSPLQQYKLKARFVDIDIDTLNIDVEKITKAITKKTKAIFAVNVLGNPVNLIKLKKICKEHKLILIEDNCESLGAKYNKKYCGTHGIMGSFSFYFSHHIHTIEGGMIVTDNESLYQYCLSLRAHGWVRDLPNQNVLFKKNGNSFEDSFMFVLPGYNLRPNEINGRVGIEQLKKIPRIIAQRRNNAEVFKSLFMNSKIVNIQKETHESSWFGFSIILKGHLKNKRSMVLNKLKEYKIETRPIISGNFLKYPVINFMDYSVYGDLKNSEEIDNNGFFIGNNHIDLERELNYFKEVIENII